jgi:hypothetical protein
MDVRCRHWITPDRLRVRRAHLSKHDVRLIDGGPSWREITPWAGLAHYGGGHGGFRARRGRSRGGHGWALSSRRRARQPGPPVRMVTGTRAWQVCDQEARDFGISTDGCAWRSSRSSTTPTTTCCGTWSSSTTAASRRHPARTVRVDGGPQSLLFLCSAVLQRLRRAQDGGARSWDSPHRWQLLAPGQHLQDRLMVVHKRIPAFI